MRSKQRSQAQWQQLISEFEASGLSQAATFATTISKLRSKLRSARFVEVRTRPTEVRSPNAAMSIGIQSETRIDFHELPPVSYLSELLTAVLKERG